MNEALTTYAVMRSFPCTWENPGDDEIVSEHASLEAAREARGALERAYEHRSYWIAEITPDGDVVAKEG